MKYNVGAIFEDAAYLTKVGSKGEYEHLTKNFKTNRLEHLSLLFTNIDAAEEKTAAIDAETKQFSLDVFEAFQKRGKVKGQTLATLNYFMIYYIFPTILSERTEDGKEICDALKTNWNATFKDCDINYTDYETLYKGFRTKIFGFPIGKQED